jgi:hypothetical protein
MSQTPNQSELRALIDSEPARAWILLENSMRLAPDDAALHYGLALFLERRGQRKGALFALREEPNDTAEFEKSPLSLSGRRS